MRRDLPEDLQEDLQDDGPPPIGRDRIGAPA